jgi:hypothetical protein
MAFKRETLALLCEAPPFLRETPGTHDAESRSVREKEMNKKVEKAWHTAEEALSKTARTIFDEQPQQPNSLRSRLILGVLIAAIYLASVLTVLMGMPDVMLMRMSDSGDSAGYLQFSPYRQPMYGTWANATYAFSGSWHTVQVFQLGAFLSCSAWVIVELAIVSRLGVIAALLFVAMQLVFTRLRLLNLVASLISEGLFYPMIVLMVAMLLTWLRTRSMGVLAGLALLLVSMTQLRTGALLVVAVPIFAALFVLARQPIRSAIGRSSVLLLGTVFIGLVFMPPLFGKAILQVNTIADPGSMLLARVSLLPESRVLGNRSPDWITMSHSWRAAAADLNAVALTQFDAQLQEAVRRDLGLKVLLPAILNRSPEEIWEGWSEGIYHDDAKRIAIEWILDQWPAYIRLSGAHLWGLLTVANFMDNSHREHVWRALNNICEATWHSCEALFRMVYPLNHIYRRLSWATNSLYLSIRYISIGVLILGAVSAMTVIRQILGNREVSPGSLAVALAVGWAIAHSIPAAFMVYPVYRYTYANMLVMFSGAAVWLAYLGCRRTPLLRALHGRNNTHLKQDGDCQRAC